MEINGELFSKNLIYLRTRYALPQKSLAKLTGISLPILKMTERGEVIPRITAAALERLCAVFAVTSDELLHRDLDPNGSENTARLPDP